jgi:formylglycine-generating enzyme required for sulfatase activity
VTRNAGATIFLTSEDEWYKAAYYNAITTSYFDYPSRSNVQTACAAPTATANRANCDNAVANLTNRGSYPGSASPYGTFDQGGNVYEWTEAFYGANRVIRGGSFDSTPLFLAAFAYGTRTPEDTFNFIGIRVASVPEPGTGLLLITGLLGLAGWRRVRD